MVVVSFAEVVSLGAVLPFLGVLTAPEKVYESVWAQPVFKHFQLQTPQELLLPVTLIFFIAVLFAGFFRIILLWAQTRISMAIGGDFSVQVYERTLYQPYSTHISRSSSEILAGTQKANALATSVIQPILLAFSSIFIILAIVSTLLFIQPVIALILLFGFGIVYMTVIFLTKHLMEKNSRIIASEQVKTTTVIQEGLGGIRDVLLSGTQALYSALYRDSYIPMRTAMARNQVIGSGPRYGIEALATGFIALLAYTLARNSDSGGISSALPGLGALALGAQRLLPLIQQLFLSYSRLKGNQSGSQDALMLLDQQIPSWHALSATTPTIFQKHIFLKDVGFCYRADRLRVLNAVNLQLPKGSRVGFVGATGSGKSTLLDIITGLLSPTEGHLLIDSTLLTQENLRSWQVRIAYVPQTVFLSESSVAANIAFGVPIEEIDMQRVMRAAQQAHILKTIESWPKGFHTFVGERGLQLSGGQRQRIGIARALYKRSEVIILDEATSALDDETEAAIIKSLKELGREVTILMVAHRLSTLKGCDFFVSLVDGKVKIIYDFDELNKAILR